MAMGQIFSFIQLQGQMKWGFAKDNPFVMALMGVPISLVFIYCTKLFNEHFGVNWPGRLIGQSIGVIMFTIMSWVLFRETLTIKTVVCLMLAFIIVFIQIYWKD